MTYKIPLQLPKTSRSPLPPAPVGLYSPSPSQVIPIRTIVTDINAIDLPLIAWRDIIYALLNSGPGPADEFNALVALLLLLGHSRSLVSGETVPV